MTLFINDPLSFLESAFLTFSSQVFIRRANELTTVPQNAMEIMHRRWNVFYHFNDLHFMLAMLE